MQRRSVRMPWHWRKRIRQRDSSHELEHLVWVQGLRLGWDPRLEADQFQAQERLSVEKPYLLILSPMRLALCWTKQKKLAEPLKQDKQHLEFACSLAQVERGGQILFGRHSRGTSLEEVLAMEVVRKFRCDQCQFGLTSVAKVTGFMTAGAYVAEAAERRCFVNTFR